MSMKVAIESGKECSLSDLFGGLNQVVIPDLQRDYCWGHDAWIQTEKRYADLVSGFVDNLLESFLKHPVDNRMMGLIYGYEQPRCHIQICDGQQRLTTLFLLLGYVNTKADGVFDEYLQCENRNNTEPRLCYAIRETTLYFLADLVRYGFVGDKGTPNSDVVLALGNGNEARPSWYFSEYDLDASIQNMISALRNIDKRFQNSCEVKDWDGEKWKAFGKYLLGKIRFLYYDMGGREKGEETYVVINTTGEPLTAAENLKPILIGGITDAKKAKQYSEEWEKREQWLWENRGDALTTDAHALRFFVWYWQIGLLQEKSWKGKRSFNLNPREIFTREPIQYSEEDGEVASTERWRTFCCLDNVEKYFSAFKSLVEIVGKSPALKSIYKSCVSGVLSKTVFDGSASCFLTSDAQEIKQWQLNMVLPAIAYLAKFDNCDLEKFEAFVRRLRKNHFDQQRSRNPNADGVSSSYVDWRHVIQIVELSETEEGVLTISTIDNRDRLKNISHVVRSEWYSDYEKEYKMLVEKNPDAMEWGDCRVLMGDISSLIVHQTDRSIDDKKTQQCWNNLERLCVSIEQQDGNPLSDPELANWYRLYRVVSQVVDIGHQYRVSWEVTGCFFTQIWDSLDSDFAFINTDSFKDLLRADDLLLTLKAATIKGIKQFGALQVDDNTNAKQLLVAWLFAKVLLASKTRKYIQKESRYPIVVANEARVNRYNEEEPLSWGNLKCLFGYLYGRHDDWGKNNWNEETRLDTPLDAKLYGAPGTIPTKDAIDAVTKKVKGLLDECLADPKLKDVSAKGMV